MTHWLFIIPLGMGLASGFYTLRSSDEVNNSLIGALSLLCLLISLLIAPWELQLLIAILVMGAARYYWLQIDRKNDKTQASQPSKLDAAPPSTTAKEESGAVRNYRGIAYEKDSSSKPAQDSTSAVRTESPAPRTYRGIAYDSAEEVVYALKKLSGSPPQKPRKYRGVTLPPDATESSEKKS